MNEKEKVGILVVDDRRDKLLAMESILRGLDEDLVLVGSGAEALRHLLERDVAVILLDIQMPVMDGFETAALIRARPRSAKTPIIFVTAYRTADIDRFAGYTLGAVDYISMPIVPEILRAKVSVFVDLHRMAQEVQRQALELRDLNLRLENQVRDTGRLNRDLTLANTELEAFSYSVSHDLKAPLRGIRGFSDLLREDYHDRLDAQGIDYLRRISASVDTMEALIEDLLSLSHVSLSPMHRQSLDLTVLAAGILRRLHDESPERRLEPVLQEDLTAVGDRNLLVLLLENLLGNAWKFSSRAQVSRIELGRGDGLEGLQTFFVRDNGVGFDPSRAERLFTPFQRLHSAAGFEGTGIGLATVKRIVTRHGGRVWAQSERGKGATFFFALPVSREENGT